MSGLTPISCTSVPSPMPSACTPIRLISCGNSQRASYSRKPVGLTSGDCSNAKVLGVSRETGLGTIGRPWRSDPGDSPLRCGEESSTLEQQPAFADLETAQPFQERHAQEAG